MLIIVLWAMIALTITAGVALSTTRQSASASSNRSDYLRLGWLAEECAADLMSRIHAVLNQPGDTTLARLSRLDERVLNVAAAHQITCDVRLIPAGMTLDVNRAGPEALYHLFRLRGYDAARAATMIAALQDWTDTDTLTRPLGAERRWYDENRRPQPRDAPIGASDEILQIRGFERDTGIVRVLGTEAAPVLLERAPMQLIAVLPGMSPEALRSIERQRAMGQPLSIAGLANSLSGPALDTLNAHVAELDAATTLIPRFWHMEVRVAAGSGVALVLRLDIAEREGAPVILRRKLESR